MDLRDPRVRVIKKKGGGKGKRKVEWRLEEEEERKEEEGEGEEELARIAEWKEGGDDEGVIQDSASEDKMELGELRTTYFDWY